MLASCDNRPLGRFILQITSFPIPPNSRKPRTARNSQISTNKRCLLRAKALFAESLPQSTTLDCSLWKVLPSGTLCVRRTSPLRLTSKLLRAQGHTGEALVSTALQLIKRNTGRSFLQPPDSALIASHKLYNQSQSTVLQLPENSNLACKTQTVEKQQELLKTLHTPGLRDSFCRPHYSAYVELHITPTCGSLYRL
jgi:hypothetical protein